MTHEELIERLEKAEGPDRKLDVAVGIYASDLNLSHFYPVLDQIGAPGGGWTPSEEDWPRYTSSIDAALTLVPEGCFVTVDRYAISHVSSGFDWRAWVKRPVGDFEGDDPCGLVKSFGSGISGAIALCIASLKARAALPPTAT